MRAEYSGSEVSARCPNESNRARRCSGLPCGATSTKHRIHVIIGGLRLAVTSDADIEKLTAALQDTYKRSTSHRATARTSAIARVKLLDSQIRAVIALDPTALDQAQAIDQRRGAHGLLYGYAIMLKDNIEADGPLPTTAGSLALVGTVTHRDAPLVKRLRAADAVILGKTNLSEWRISVPTYPFQVGAG